MASDSGFRVADVEVMAQAHHLRFEKVSLETPDGSIASRSVVRVGGAVGVVAVDGDEIVLIRQYRTPLDREILELPAGLLDVDGEDPKEAAARELIEETGFQAGRIEEISRYHTSPGYSDEFVIVYLATDLTEVGANRMGPEEEAAEVVRVPISELPDLLPEIEDSKTLIGLQAYLLAGAEDAS